jgi:hypothetical protein
MRTENIYALPIFIWGGVESKYARYSHSQVNDFDPKPSVGKMGLSITKVTSLQFKY